MGRLLVADGRLEAERDRHKRTDGATERTGPSLQRAVVAVHVTTGGIHVGSALLLHVAVVSRRNVERSHWDESHSGRFQT